MVEKMGSEIRFGLIQYWKKYGRVEEFNAGEFNEGEVGCVEDMNSQSRLLSIGFACWDGNQTREWETCVQEKEHVG